MIEPAWPAVHVGWVGAHTAPPIVVNHGEDSMASDVMLKSPQMIKGTWKKARILERQNRM